MSFHSNPFKPPDPLFSTRPDPFPPTRILFPSPPPSVMVFASSASSSSSFYELLGIPETGTMMEIKKAYKQLARKYHPDVSPPGRVEEYTKRFIRVQEAYETLSDPKRRELYDQNINGGVSLGFSSRRRCQRTYQQTVDKSEWKGIWQSQLAGLKNQNMYKGSGDDMTWGERMRQKREESES